jgi:2-keto-4-pentenoate hydratase
VPACHRRRRLGDPAIARCIRGSARGLEDRGFVALGPPTADWDPGELPGHRGVMLRDGEEVAAGIGADVLGDPCEAMVWLANELRARGLGLLAGDLVITGACTPPHRSPRATR